jgi:nitrogen fixation protein NifB
VGAHIYLEVRPDPAPAGLGELRAAFLVRRQLAGIRRAVAAGLTVKVNTVLIPGVNFEGAGPGALEAGAPESGALETGAPQPGQSEIGLVARAVAQAGHPSTTSCP